MGWVNHKWTNITLKTKVAKHRATKCVIIYQNIHISSFFQFNVGISFQCHLILIRSNIWWWCECFPDRTRAEHFLKVKHSSWCKNQFASQTIKISQIVKLMHTRNRQVWKVKHWWRGTRLVMLQFPAGWTNLRRPAQCKAADCGPGPQCHARDSKSQLQQEVAASTIAWEVEGDGDLMRTASQPQTQCSPAFS